MKTESVKKDVHKVIKIYNDLKMKDEFSISNFDDLILASLNAKA